MVSASAAPTSVERECVLLARQIFGFHPSPDCIDAYRRANDVVFGDAARRDPFHQRIAEAARRGWDLEALEFALRVRDKSGPLTKKVNILFYIVEATPEGFTRFVNTRRSAARAWLTLSGQTLRTIYKLLKGLILARRLSRLPVPAAHD